MDTPFIGVRALPSTYVSLLEAYEKEELIVLQKSTVHAVYQEYTLGTKPRPNPGRQGLCTVNQTCS